MKDGSGRVRQEHLTLCCKEDNGSVHIIGSSRAKIPVPTLRRNGQALLFHHNLLLKNRGIWSIWILKRAFPVFQKRFL